ncbi:MAG: hypothetical protein RR444_09350 [Oscillospiraceae bacterium]
MIEWGYLFLWCWVAYLTVTLVGIGHTVFNWKVLKMEGAKSSPPKSIYDIDAYAKTVPWHAFYNIVLWPIFAYIYFIMVKPTDLWLTAFWLGLIWCILSIIIDLVGWVLIRHPWSVTYKEFYVDYQPWITLIYISMFVSPFIGALFI